VSHVIDHNTLSKEATKVGCKMEKELSSSTSSKENMSTPVIAAVEGGFHTQFLLFTRNDVTSAPAAAKAAFLLKVYSNCCWDSIRPRILEMIARQCPDNTVYPPLQQMHIDGFLVEILPKADGPEMLPPDAQKKLSSRTLHAICIRVTVDHSAINTPLCTSLSTGLSAFTKLRMKFTSEKSYRNIESLHSAVEKGNARQHMPTSVRSFPNRPVKSKYVSQSSAAAVNSGKLDKNCVQTTRRTNSISMDRSSPQLLADSIASDSAKYSQTTVSVVDAKSPVIVKSECAQEPVALIISPVTEMSTSASSSTQSVTTSDMTGNESSTVLHSTCDDVPPPVMVLPPSAYSSEFSLFPTTGSSNSYKNLKSLLLPIILPESEKIILSSPQSYSKDASCSSQTLKKPISPSTISHTVHEGTAGVIVVEDDDILPSNASVIELPVPSIDTRATISSVENGSVQLSGSVAVQNISMHEKSTLPDQSVSDVPVLSCGATHPVSLANINENGVFNDTAMSVGSLSMNTAFLQPTSCQESVLMESFISARGYEHTAVKLENGTKSEESENKESSSSNTEAVLTRLHITKDSPPNLLEDTETAAQGICMTQPDAHKVDAISLICNEEFCEDAKNYSVAQQKQANNGQQSRSECLSVASASTDEVVCTAANSISQLLLPEQSSVTISGYQQPYPTDSSDAPVREDNVVQIIQSDEVCTRFLKVKCPGHVAAVS